MTVEMWIAIIGILVSGIGLIVMIGIPLIGFAYKSLQRDIDGEERRRGEAIAGVMLQVNRHYDQLRGDIFDLRNDFKDIRNEPE